MCDYLYMKKRRSLTQQEQVQTLGQYIRGKGWTQAQFVRHLESKGITITAQYVNDVLCGRKKPGKCLIEVFREITGFTLVGGLIEEDHGKR